jgi:antitoxin component of RelBE/YafQ-DinJ toxin-antitoxin module
MTTKDSGMRIRIERELRDAFVQACQAQGLGASEVLRDFMRSFTAKHSTEQAMLFGRGDAKKTPR